MQKKIELKTYKKDVSTGHVDMLNSDFISRYSKPAGVLSGARSQVDGYKGTRAQQDGHLPPPPPVNRAQGALAKQGMNQVSKMVAAEGQEHKGLITW